MQPIHHERTSSSPPEVLWQRLGDSATWPDWTSIDAHKAIKPGGPDGVGEQREFKNGRVTVREEIIERRPNEHLTYAVIGGLAVRDYRAAIDLEPTADGGTKITWHTTFAAKIPGTGWLYRRALDAATEEFIDGLAG